MARASPSVLRIAAILRFMSRHPGVAFSLSELSRALKISAATCHSLLLSLVEVGFLYRTSSKSYVLGPELAVIGKSAADHISPLQIAQPEMRALADEFDVVCSAAFLDNYVSELRARAESLSFVGSSAPLGARFVVRIPLAAVFISWWPDAEIEAWLDKRQPPPTATERELQHANIAFARQHGFVVFVNAAAAADADAERREPDVAPLNELDEGGRYAVSSIIAPVFETHERVAFSLTLVGFNRTMSGAEILAAAARLTAACERIGDFIGGKRSGLKRAA